jgi:NADH-quinone oxidoreductase subunit J
MVELVVFVFVGSAAIAGALAVIFARNPVYAAMGLLGTLFSLGVFYVVNLGHLIAAVQVIVYAGAVLTLFLFVIMMIGVDRVEDTSETLPFQRQLVIGLAAILGVTIGALVLGGEFAWVPLAVDGPIPNGTVENIAGIMFTDWLLPFEVTALLLTIGAAGAIALAYYPSGAITEEAE